MNLVIQLVSTLPMTVPQLALLSECLLCAAGSAIDKVLVLIEVVVFGQTALNAMIRSSHVTRSKVSISRVNAQHVGPSSVALYLLTDDVWCESIRSI